MKILSLSEAKSKLSQLVNEVNSRNEEITITKNGKPAAVLVSPDEYESWKESFLIRADQKFMAEIQKGLKDIIKESK